MAKYDWTGVKKEHVEKAIELFLKDNSEHPNARTTFLLYEEKKLPAKHIRGMAYKIAFNQEISKDDYNGGKETVQFFEQLGFEMCYPGQTNASVKKKQPKAPKVITKKRNDIDKIRITSKGVIEQKNALQLILNRVFKGDIVCEKTYPWLRTPSEISESKTSLFVKKSEGFLPVDLLNLFQACAKLLEIFLQ